MSRTSAQLIADALIDEGYDVACARDGAEAMAAASAAAFDLVLADIRLPKVDGLTLFRWLRAERPTTDVIVMTGDAAVADAVAVLKEGRLRLPDQADQSRGAGRSAAAAGHLPVAAPRRRGNPHTS